MTRPRAKKQAATRPRAGSGPADLSPARAALLEAHVRFELERWSGAGLHDAIREEVEALYAWLASLRLADLAPAETVAPALARLAGRLPLTEATATTVAEVFMSLVAAADRHDLRVRDAVRREDLMALVDTAAGLDRLRDELVGALTESSAYRRLVAYVLYQGVKDYVLTENVFARRIPGASSFVRFGQRGLQSAAPGLEQAVDHQLSAFVETNIGETLRDSRRYLEATLDAPMIRSLAEEAWATLGPRRLADIAGLADEDDVDDLAADAVTLVRQAVGSGRLTRVVESAVRDLLTRHAHESPAELLRDLGLGEDAVVNALTHLAEATDEPPLLRGFVESRIRARLGAFYADSQCPVDE